MVIHCLSCHVMSCSLVIPVALCPAELKPCFTVGRCVETIFSSSSLWEQAAFKNSRDISYRFEVSDWLQALELVLLLLWYFRCALINLTLKAVTESEPNVDGPWAFLDTALHHVFIVVLTIVVLFGIPASYVAIYLDLSATSEYVWFSSYGTFWTYNDTFHWPTSSSRTIWT